MNFLRTCLLSIAILFSLAPYSVYAMSTTSSNSDVVINVDQDNTCSICLGEFVATPSKLVVQVTCDPKSQHTFHQECILNWFTKSETTTSYDTRKCPLCDQRYQENKLPTMQEVHINDTRGIDDACVVCKNSIKESACKKVPVYQLPCASNKKHFVHNKCKSNIQNQCPICKSDLNADDKKVFLKRGLENIRMFNKEQVQTAQPSQNTSQQPDLIDNTLRTSRVPEKLCPSCKHTSSELQSHNMPDNFVKFVSCNHELCVTCMTRTLKQTKKICPSCPREQQYNPRIGNYEYVDKELSTAEIRTIRVRINPMQWWLDHAKNVSIGAGATLALGYVSYYMIKDFSCGQFNLLEYSADEIVKAFISEEPYWDFDLYNRPVTMFELRDQYDITSIINSAASDELKQKLEIAINNFDNALHAVWSALEHGYYNKGKSTLMRDKKDLVQNLQQSAQTLKDILAACRAQVSVWKRALGITALGALGIGAWLYAQ